MTGPKQKPNGNTFKVSATPVGALEGVCQGKLTLAVPSYHCLTHSLQPAESATDTGADEPTEILDYEMLSYIFDSKAAE